MKYTYYPGCSVHVTSKAYDESTKEVCSLLDIELEELKDWNCCGATAYMSVNELLSFCLSARNLAIAEKMGRDVLTTCAACYTVLRKTEQYMDEFPDLKDKVAESLKAGGLTYSGKKMTKHLLDVFVNVIGLEKIKEKVTDNLDGLKVACYYGCQIVRPKGGFDDHEAPKSFENLMTALGATPTHYPMKLACCSGSIIGTAEDVALRLVKNILLAAEQNKADVIATACPLCQLNLDAYQQKVNAKFGFNFNIPIVFFTQVMGMAFGVTKKKLGLHRLIVPTDKVLATYK